jgi:hypothetical protein
MPKGTTGGGSWAGEYLIDMTGSVARVWTTREITFTPPLPAFNESIVTAIRRWKFEPTRVNGVAVPLCMSLAMSIDWN